MRIHVEGVVNTREEATLGYFFNAIKGDFTSNSILGYKNGDICPNTNKPGKIRMFVNNVENFEFRNHEISHYAKVPPGDKIKIICLKHGVFEQVSRNHKNLKQGCPKCVGMYQETMKFIVGSKSKRKI